jgi:ankyrin repeat protein
MELSSKDLDQQLIKAIQDKNYALVKSLIDQHKDIIDVNAADEKRHTLLHWAAREGATEIAKLLIDKGADVNAIDYIGSTPLHIALWKGDKDIAELLIEKGADVNP